MGSRKVRSPRADGVAGRGGGRASAGPPVAPGVAAEPAGSGRPGLLPLLLDLLVVGVVVVYLITLWRQASPARFASDECFHAWVSEWIAAHGRLPRTLPEFYSGLPYFYPPLFHLVGAAAVRLAGAGSLATLNVVLAGVLFATLYLLPVPGLSRTARRCAVLLCLATPALSLYTVRFYAETLATLLAVLVVMLLLRARARPGRGAGILLGVAVGAALLAKQPAAVLPFLLLALAVLDRLRGRRELAATMTLALAVGLAVSLPFFARNAMLFGSPFYPPVTTNAQVALDVMNTRLFSLPASVFYRNALAFVGPVVPWVAVAALVWNLARRRFDLTTGLLAACIAFILLAPWVPRFQPRHLNPLTAMMALLGSLVLADGLARRPRVVYALQAILILGCAALATRLSGIRAGLDVSPTDQESYRAIAAHVPAGGMVLSRSTYATFYYARRSATWPVPWSGSADQIELFREQDPDRFLAALRRLGIDHLLIPRRTAVRRFDGANFPESLVDCVAALVERGQLRVLWGSEDLVLLGTVD